VEDNPKLALYHVLNYPNPFTTKTTFSFEHNRPGDALDIRIEIYTASGKLVKTLQQFVSANTRRISDFEWDGLDEYGDRIGKGVYIYRVAVKDSKGERVVKYQKLVLLR
jgi:flagellar hook assembly protein FlgD